MRRLRIGERELEFGSSALGALHDSTSDLEDTEALRQQLEAEGYLLLRGLQLKERVLRARRALLAALAENDQLADGEQRDLAVAAPGARGGFHGGSKAMTRSPELLGLMESPEIMRFFSRLLGSDVLTYNYKWLRVVPPGGFTGAHYDIVYMGRGTKEVYTCWTPIGDVPFEMGPLAILAGATGMERVRQTYGRMDVDRDHVTGWFTNDPLEMTEKYGGQWRTAEFRAGDVLIFGMFTMHMSLTNVSKRFRITADTRYQRASEPVDERWVGENPKAHYAWMQGETVAMETMKERWRV